MPKIVKDIFNNEPVSTSSKIGVPNISNAGGEISSG